MKTFLRRTSFPGEFHASHVARVLSANAIDPSSSLGAGRLCNGLLDHCQRAFPPGPIAARPAERPEARRRVPHTPPGCRGSGASGARGPRCCFRGVSRGFSAFPPGCVARSVALTVLGTSQLRGPLQATSSARPDAPALRELRPPRCGHRAGTHGPRAAGPGAAGPRAAGPGPALSFGVRPCVSRHRP